MSKLIATGKIMEKRWYGSTSDKRLGIRLSVVASAP
jgi:hypothetical protein